MHPDMDTIRCTIMRGGTSKGIFIMQNELPRDPESRDTVIRAIFGSPDIRQIDGLGGADTLTSKLAIIAPSDRTDADVDYTFAQVSIGQAIVDYRGNCGNISSGVGPFAIDEGLVKATESTTLVRIYQTNTQKMLIAEVPVKNGKALTAGDFHIDGVPGTGAKITMDFTDTIGSETGRLLPTGSPKDKIDVAGKMYEISIVDAGNPVVFIKASALHMKGTESPAEIEGNKARMDMIEHIRGLAAEKIGMVKSWEEAAACSPYAPFFAIVSEPQAYRTIYGEEIRQEETDLVSRLVFMQKMHKAYPGTGAVCTGAAACIPGSVVWDVIPDKGQTVGILNIGHPAGIMQVEYAVRSNRESIVFDRLAFYRTARRIMDGFVYIDRTKWGKR